MNSINRRHFVATLPVLAGAALAGISRAAEPAVTPRKMTISLSCGAIGVSANQKEAIRLAAAHRFEAVEAYPEYLAAANDSELNSLLTELKGHGLSFGAANLPIEFRRDELRFRDGMKGFAKLVAGARRAGIERWGTWLMPCDNSRTYLQNFRQHADRLREVALVLKEHGQRLGLEYVGTKTSRDRCRFPFVHCFAELKELIAEIGTGNVGFILDSWHWWQADDSVENILSLSNADVVSVDLNDAPAGVPKDQQQDGKRELPAATGVIDTAAFLRALNTIGYDGPVRAEPFNKPLNDLGNEEACAATIAAMRKAFATLDS